VRPGTQRGSSPGAWRAQLNEYDTPILSARFGTRGSSPGAWRAQLNECNTPVYAITLAHVAAQGDLHEALEAVLPGRGGARERPSERPSESGGAAGEGPEGEGSAGAPGSAAQPPGLECNTKRTYQPSNLVRQRRPGFMARLRTKGGRAVIARRLRKGRRKITA